MEGIGRLTDITIDTVDVEQAVAFWGAVLGVRRADSFGPYTNLEPLAGGITVGFQRVPEPKAGKARIHLDVTVDDLDAAVTRVEQLGGRLIGHVEEGGHRWAVMADPEGNEFCLL